MEIYKIHKGVLRLIPEDYQLKQGIKYILLFAFGFFLSGICR